MRSRPLLRLFLVACLLAMLGACATAPLTVEIPQQQLQAALERRFSGEARAGRMLPITLGVGTVQLLPEHNRVRLDFSFEAPARMPRAVRGGLALSFGLRYAPEDRTLRAADVRVEQVDLQGLPAEAHRFVQMAGAVVAERMLQDSVLYTLGPQDIARAGGRTPGEIRVTSTGVRIELVPQPAPVLR